MGGYLTDVYSWPWIFYINVPIGLFSAFLAWEYLKDRETELKRYPIDWTGLVLLSLGVACMQVMLDKGKDLDWFESNVIITLTIVSLISISYFGLWTIYQKYPIVDLTHFKNRNFLIGTICITVGYLLFFGSTVILPLWLQTEQGYTSYWAGVAVAPIGLVPLLLSSRLGKNLYRLDLRFVTALSFLLFSLSFFYQSNFMTTISLGHVMFTRLLQGFGVLFFFLPLVQLSLGGIPKERYASASGLFNFIRILVGSGFGTSLSIQLWTRLEIFHHARLTEANTVYTPLTEQFYQALANAGTEFTFPVIDRILDMGIEQQAFILSTNDASWLAAWLFLALIPLPFLCKRITMTSTSVEAVH